MVDFDNEATVGTPSANVVKILILQARANALESLEHYNKQMSEGVQASQGTLKGRLGSWFLEHSPYIKRTKGSKEDLKEFEEIQDLIFFNMKELEDLELKRIVNYLNEICDTIKLTRIDLKRAYDRTLIEEDNKNNELS